MSKTLKWRIAQKLELGWWKRYLLKKDVDGYLSWKKHYWNNFLAEIKNVADPADADKILDAGCGPAGIFTVLPDFEVMAIDPLLDAYEQNLPHFNRNFYPDIDFEAVSIEEFSSEKRFQYIFCLNAINHVSDINRSFDVLFNHLASDGKLILSIDSHRFSWLKGLFRLLPGDALHPHQYDLKDYLAFITLRKGVTLETRKLKAGKIFDYYVIVARKGS